MDRLYPIHLAEIEPWAKRHGTTRDEARKRFAQYAILEAVAAAPGLAGALAFKGGNALRFVYGNRRSTLDLDFTADATLPDDHDAIRQRLDVGLRAIRPRFSLKARAQRVARKPPGLEKTRPTYDVTVGYMMPGDRMYNNFDLNARPVPTIVQVEITLNDLICHAVPHRLVPEGRELLVSTLEDITAEKLRALLQQPIRNRSRPQDVHDLAQITRRDDGLDLAQVSDFLIRKSEIREIHPRKSQFNEVVKSLAHVGYDDQLSREFPEFLPFDEAWSCVLGLVSKLDIPE